MKSVKQVHLAVFLAAALLCAAVWPAAADQKKDFRESGEFKIYAGGNEIGTERYAIETAGDTVASTSTLDFRNPGESHQKVQLETKLEMNTRFVPKSYVLKSNVDGKKGTISGEFSPNQIMFAYVGTDGSTRKSGMLIGNEYTVLDTNIFHHFAFLARLFNFDGKEKKQKFEVVIPQEEESGFVTVSEVGKENLTVRGKKVDTHHLQVDSGSVQIQMWIDSQRIIQKISVPSRGIEVLRN